MAFNIRRSCFNSHESDKLNALLGKQVKITLFSGKTIIGILTKSKYGGRYSIATPYGEYTFYKTHVKKMEADNGGN